MYAQEADVSANRTEILSRAQYLKNIYRFDDALEILESIRPDNLSSGPVDSELLGIIADCHYQNGNMLKALELYSALSDCAPENVLYKIRKMQVFYRNKDYERCVREGESIIQTDTIPAIVSMIGDTFNQVGQPDSARVYYELALEVKPGNESVASKLGKILIDEGEYDKAVDLADEILKLNPDSEIMTSLKGLGQYLKEDYEAAAGEFQKLYDQGNGSYQVAFYLGQSYWHLNMPSQAEGCLLEAWQLDSSNVNLAYTIAAAKAEENKPFEQEVKPWLDKAVAMVTPSPALMTNIYRQYSMGYIQDGDMRGALDNLNKAYALSPDNLSIMFSIAGVYEKNKDYKTALEWYERCLKNTKPDTRLRSFAEESIQYLKEEIFMEEGR